MLGWKFSPLVSGDSRRERIQSSFTQPHACPVAIAPAQLGSRNTDYIGRAVLPRVRCLCHVATRPRVSWGREAGIIKYFHRSGARLAEEPNISQKSPHTGGSRMQYVRHSATFSGSLQVYHLDCSLKRQNDLGPEDVGRTDRHCRWIPADVI